MRPTTWPTHALAATRCIVTRDRPTARPDARQRRASRGEFAVLNAQLMTCGDASASGRALLSSVRHALRASSAYANGNAIPIAKVAVLT